MNSSPVCERDGCRERLRASARSVARFCSTRCRVAAHRARSKTALPSELRDAARWVTHDQDKSPRRTDGTRASSTDPATWTTYTAVRQLPRRGFVLDGDGIVCIDLDHCLDAHGTLSPLAAALLDRCPPTYVEVSPSGDGLHVWGHGDVPRGRRMRRAGGPVEVYGTGRYITITGRPHQGAPAVLGDLSGVIRWLTT